MVDYYVKFCSRCKYKDISETASPCKECIDALFEDHKKKPINPNYKMSRFVKENKNGKQ